MSLAWPNPLDILGAHAFAVGITLLACVGWVLAEYAARRVTWRKGASRRRSSALDQRTYPIIAVALVGTLVMNVLLFFSGATPYLPPIASVIGAGLMVLGFGLRYYAMWTLGGFFTNPITIRPDQRIVREGPYRYLRHPAYTGGLLVAVGFPLALGLSVGFLLTLAACGYAYVHRIRIEEAALLSHFGDQYREYSRGTFRLFPGLY